MGSRQHAIGSKLEVTANHLLHTANKKQAVSNGQYALSSK